MKAMSTCRWSGTLCRCALGSLALRPSTRAVSSPLPRLETVGVRFVEASLDVWCWKNAGAWRSVFRAAAGTFFIGCASSQALVAVVSFFALGAPRLLRLSYDDRWAQRVAQLARVWWRVDRSG